MKEIVNKLHENRQVELAKSILESKGYKVSKRLNESVLPLAIKVSDLLSGREHDYTESTKQICKYLDSTPDNVYFMCEDDAYDYDCVGEFESEVYEKGFKEIKDISRDPIIEKDLGLRSKTYLGTLSDGTKAVLSIVVGYHMLYYVVS